MEDAKAIRCETTGKLLARQSAEGIYLWCKQCKAEHFIAWTSGDIKAQRSDKVASEAVLCYNIST